VRASGQRVGEPYETYKARLVEAAYLKGTTLVRDGKYVCERGHRFNETFLVTAHGLTSQRCPWCMTNRWSEWEEHQ
jgi:hypothetical protein